MAWGQELVQQSILQYVCFTFMIAGHTNFSVDRLFSCITQGNNKSDTFTVEELAEVIQQHATTFIEDGTLVCTWRTKLGAKYTTLPGITDFHDFFIIKNSVTGNVLLKVHQQSYKGQLQATPMRLVHGHTPTECVIPDETTSYRGKGLVKELNCAKLTDLNQMYTTFIPHARWLSFLQCHLLF